MRPVLASENLPRRLQKGADLRGGVRQAQLAYELAQTALRDRAAFRRLYDASASSLLTLAFGITEDQEAAQAIVHEAFLDIWACACHFDPQFNEPLEWCRNFARRRSIEWCNSHGRPDCRAELLGHLQSSPGEPLLKTMFLRGLGYADAARALGVPVGQVRKQVRLAILEVSLREQGEFCSPSD